MDVHFGLLPDDVVLIIFSKLLSTEDRNSFGLTCKRCLEIQNLTRRSLVFEFSYDPNIYKHYIYVLPRVLARFPRLHKLSLAGCTELSDSAIIGIRVPGFYIRHLSFYCCFRISDHGFGLASAACPNLASLTLYRCNVTDIGLRRIAKNCKFLANINLSYCGLISDQGLNALARGCQQLNCVIISYCKGIAGTGFVGCSETLAYLEADSCTLRPEGILAAIGGSGLELLSISNLRNWVTADGLYLIGSGFAKKLRFLNLRMCRFVGDGSVIAIAEGCPLLEEWSLGMCHEVRTSGWQAIGSNCKKLKVLDVNRCRNLTDQGLQALVGCIRLEVLYMLCCRLVTIIGKEMFKILRQDVEIREKDCLSIGPSLGGLFGDGET